MNPTINDLHVNRPLTTIANNYMVNQTRFAADRVFPVLRVDEIAAAYYKMERGDWHRIEALERAPSTESYGADFRVTQEDVYRCRRYALHSDLDYVTEGVAAKNGFDLERAKTNFVMQNLMLLREQKFKNTFFSTGIWGRDRNGDASSPVAPDFLPWDVANSTPITDIRSEITFIEDTQGYRPNVLVLTQGTIDVLLEHSTIVERMKYTQAGLVSMQLLAALLGVERIVVASALVNSAAEGATDAFGRMYGDHALLVYATDTPNIQIPSGGYIFSYTAGMGPDGWIAYTRKMQLETRTAFRIECEMFFDMQVIVPELGTFFNNVLS